MATVTSEFGSGKRESHDSTAFYGRFTPPVISDDEVADNSVALVVTSPPYFAGKEYETDMSSGHVPSSYVEYLEMLRDVLTVCLRKLEPGGRMAINIANLGRKPDIELANKRLGAET